MKKQKALMIPLVLCEIYWILSYLIYRFGVIEHPFKNDIWVLVFVVACSLLFAVGYVVIIKYLEKKSIDAKENSVNISKFLWFALIVSIIIAIPNCIRYTGYWYPPLIKTLMNPGETYLRVTSSIVSSTVINWIGFFDFFPFVIFPLTFFYWDKLGRNIKIVSCVVSMYYLIIYCSCGRNMPTIYFVFSVMITFFAMICSGLVNSKKVAARCIVIVLVMFVLAAVMFKLNLASRTLYSGDVEEQLSELNDSNESGQNDGNKQGNGNKVDNENQGESTNKVDDKQENIFLQYKDLIITNEQKENCEQIGKIFPMYTNPYTKSYVKVDDPIYRVLPESMRFVYVMGSMYLSSSYHVLSVAMRMDFEWTYGMGCSEFLMDYFNRFTGINIKEKSYGYRAMQLTDPSIVSTYGWPTSYVQLASDFTFPGVVVLFLVLGALTALVWREVIRTKNVYGIPLIIEIALMYLFIPANCITFCSGGYFTIFFGSLILFLLSLYLGKKRNKA